MGLAEETITKLAQRHAAEKELVRDVARRYERAATAATRAREALEVAESERVSVLAEWAASPGWSAERVGEYTGLAAKEVADALRAAATRTRHVGAAAAGGRGGAARPGTPPAPPGEAVPPDRVPPSRRGVAFGATSGAA